jgi:hypothetical protein
METNKNQPERITNYYTRDDRNDQPKNANGAQDHQGPSQKLNLNEMQHFIKEALTTISAFAKQLEVPTDSAPTPSDK